MKIAVALKQVPARDSSLRVDVPSHWIEETDLGFEINEPDAYALEAGLQLKEKHGGDLLVVSAGPERAAQSIREALAKGADRAIHIEEDVRAWDTLGVARLLSRALEPEKPDVILTGLQSDDLGYAQTGVIMAEMMGIPHATIIMQVDVTDGRLRVKRELEQGWFQNVELPLPALLTIQSGISKLRYATLMGIKKAKTKEVRRVTAAGLGVEPSQTVAVTRVYAPERAKQTEMLEGPPKQAAAKLVERLRFAARVL